MSILSDSEIIKLCQDEVPTNYAGTLMSSGNWNNIHWAMNVRRHGILRCQHYGYAITGTTVIQNNLWYNYVWTKNGTSEQIYLNGIMEISGNSNVDLYLTSDSNTIMLGRETYYNGYFAFKGKIQDVRIYNRALSPEEVLINYNLTKADKTAMIQAENGTTYLNKIKEC